KPVTITVTVVHVPGRVDAGELQVKLLHLVRFTQPNSCPRSVTAQLENHDPLDIPGGRDRLQPFKNNSAAATVHAEPGKNRRYACP
ncbi:MAG: hypothetical protein ABWX92_14190, partial [Mycetocola sp.]